MVKKIQLNDEQWKTLQALLRADARRLPASVIRVSDRLRSNGFVASDRQGRAYLTDQGADRLGQGR
jgi:hypothetical protein